MAVNLAPPDPASLRPVAGVELGCARAGIRRAPGNDLMLMRVVEGTEVAGVFTQNSFAAAPVQICRERLAAGVPIRALVVNAGNANCGTGEAGLEAARRACAAAARELGVAANAVLPFSTGVILEPLPVERIESALPACVSALAASNWRGAAEAIMTTDTVPKGASVAAEAGGVPVTVTGIAKGVGMLAPDMATMLTFVATDAVVARGALSTMVKEVAELSFNRVTVDGDTSTNDSFVLAASGRARMPVIDSKDDPRYAELRDAVVRVAVPLAQAIARDGEGATKFITIEVGGAAGEAEALAVARRIANSPLVKTALFASDPNLGRLVMAIGNAGIVDLDISRVNLWLGDVLVLERGGRAVSYREQDGARMTKPAEIDIGVDLGRGTARSTVWTCDFSYDYVKINAEYRT
ncbi:MAG: bifunctional glutamate N-acetyltransferase/amino-acid acetyltransferase ArgJ [Burkholderiales bacterium]|nr:bifunctional glutamate N-acetyltransferase/amino-acid acetyltransferase ArgJ [Burkholderiales bacterium]